MDAKEKFAGLVVTVVGGIVVFWATSGLLKGCEELTRNGSRMSPEVNFDRGGSDYKDVVVSGFQACMDACVREAPCRAVTFNKTSRQCWMKNSVPLRRPDPAYDSAVKIDG